MSELKTESQSELVISDLTAGYRGFKPVFENVSLRVKGPGLFRLTGVNGAGKSTLFEVLSGYIEPKIGTVTFSGKALDKQSALQISTFIRHDESLVPYMAVSDNLALFSKRFGADIDKVFALAKRWKLDEHLDKISSELSVGTLRKVWILCCLQSNRPLLCLDEPFNGLDDDSAGILSEILAEKARNQTVLVISHILPPSLESEKIEANPLGIGKMHLIDNA